MEKWLRGAGKGPFVLILSPTRELAQQIAAVMEESGKASNLKTLCAYGGVPKPPQVHHMTVHGPLHDASQMSFSHRPTECNPPHALIGCLRLTVIVRIIYATIAAMKVTHVTAQHRSPAHLDLVQILCKLLLLLPVAALGLLCYCCIKKACCS